MIKEDQIVTLTDDKKYYVLDSIIYNNINYLMIGEYDEPNMKILDNVKIMVNNVENNELSKVVEPRLLYILTNLFAAKDEASNT